MIDWIVRTMDTLGYAGIVFLMALENVFPPIPSEAIMPAAGFAATRGEMSFVGVLLAGTLGSVLGALPWYFAGRWVGTAGVRRFVERYGRYLFLTTRDVDRADAWFDRNNVFAVTAGRCVPGVRTLISLPAGVSEMPIAPFLLYTVLGSALWNVVLTTAGYTLGENWRSVEHVVGPLGLAVVLGLTLAAAFWLVRRARGSGGGA